MKVVCINSCSLFPPGNIVPNLTDGKVYDVMVHNELRSKDSIILTIEDDSGFINKYHKSRFITLEEYRNNQLNRILK